MRAGTVAVLLSALAADYFFLQPIYHLAATTPSQVALGLFVIFAMMQVGLVALLNTTIDRFWRAADNFRFVIDAEPTGLIAVDDAGRVQLVNAAIEHQFGYRREELFGQPVELLVPETARERHADTRAAYLQSPEAREMGAGRDIQARRKDGSTLRVEVVLNPIERAGKTGALATIVDISERVAAERRRQILTSEIRHRGRNLLSVVQAIAARTMIGERSMDEARSRFLAAIQALARTHDLFLDAAVAPLAKIAEGELLPFGDRATIDMCDLMLSESAAQDFAMIIHELATNAVKYGALSGSKGLVAISGCLTGDQLEFVWEERDGPRVSPPRRQGFGHTILSEVARRFGSKVEIDFRPEGLRYALTADLEKISHVVDPPLQ